MMARTEDYKRELVSILFAQKHVIFWTAFLIFLGGVLVAFYWPPTYSASGSVLVRSKQPEKSPEAIEEPRSTVFEINKEDLASEVEMLQSPDVIRNAVKYLGTEYPAYRTENSDELARAVYRISENLRTQVVPASNVISIQYLCKDSKEAVDTLSVLMEQYVLYRMRLYNPSQSSKFFAFQADRFKDALEAKEGELMDLVSMSGISSPGKEIESNIVLKKALERELNLLRNEYIDVEMNFEHVTKALASEDVQFFSFVDSGIITGINGLSTRLADLEVERGRLLRTYHPDSDVIHSVEEQIADTFALLKGEVLSYSAEVQKNYQALGEKIRNLELAISGYDETNVDLQKQLIMEERIQREIDMLTFSYETFSKRQEEAEINKSIDSDVATYVSIMSKAFPSDGPVFPKKKLVLYLALFAGLITGCSLGFLREYFDHSFKRPSDVAAYAELPVLFSLGKSSNASFRLLYAVVVVALIVGMIFFLLSKFRVLDLA